MSTFLCYTQNRGYGGVKSLVSISKIYLKVLAQLYRMYIGQRKNQIKFLLVLTFIRSKNGYQNGSRSRKHQIRFRCC